VCERECEIGTRKKERDSDGDDGASSLSAFQGEDPRAFQSHLQERVLHLLRHSSKSFHGSHWTLFYTAVASSSSSSSSSSDVLQEIILCISVNPNPPRVFSSFSAFCFHQKQLLHN
jgi:hypothetical protein